jgi:hypothetical protein
VPPSETARLDAPLARVAALLAEEPDAMPVRVARVSLWSVGEQLDHLLKVLEAGLDRLEPPGEPLRRGINLAGRICLGVGRFPRGVGKSPARMRAEVRERADLAASLAAVRVRVGGLAGRDELWRSRTPVFKHPYFGGLDPRQAVRFLEVHTDHHLRIVADIRRAAR